MKKEIELVVNEILQGTKTEIELASLLQNTNKLPKPGQIVKLSWEEEE